jgi:membrane protease YdiL (CAAX protease family)
LGVGFVAFIGVSTAYSALNLSASIAAGLFTLAAVTYIGLNLAGHDWRTVTGLSRVSASDVALGAVLALANAVSVGDWLTTLSAKLFPQFILDLFDTSRILAAAMSNSLEKSVVLLCVVVLAPLAEEFFFRGVLFQGLSRRLSVTWSAVLSAVIFSAYHLDPVNFVARAEIGLVLAGLVFKTGSLWPAIAAHAANNALATLSMIPSLAEANIPAAVSLIGFGVFIAVGVWLWRRPSPEPAADLARNPPSVARSVTPWAAALFVAALLIALFDARGSALTRIDLSSPLIGTADEPAEARLLDLRAQARRGEVPVETYRVERSELSARRFKSLFQRLLPGPPKP